MGKTYYALGLLYYEVFKLPLLKRGFGIAKTLSVGMLFKNQKKNKYSDY